VGTIGNSAFPLCFSVRLRRLKKNLKYLKYTRIYYIFNIIASQASEKKTRLISTIHRSLTIPSAAWEGRASHSIKPWLGGGRIAPTPLDPPVVGDELMNSNTSRYRRFTVTTDQYTAVFTALHRMQTRSSEEKAVRSVCLPNAWIVTKVTEERSVQIFIPYERSFSLVFWEEWLVWGGDPFYLKFWVNWPLLERNRRFWTDIR